MNALTFPRVDAILITCLSESPSFSDSLHLLLMGASDAALSFCPIRSFLFTLHYSCFCIPGRVVSKEQLIQKLVWRAGLEDRDKPVTVMSCPWVTLGLGGGNTVEGPGKMVTDPTLSY